MKRLLLSFFLLSTYFNFASGTDSLFHRHSLNVAIANGMSQEFFYAPNMHKLTTVVGGLAYTGGTQFKPSYAAHVQLNYSLGVSRSIRIETGLGYLLSGAQSTNDDSKTSAFEGSLTIPIHVKFVKRLRKGSFTCALGPEFTLPVHEFYHLAYSGGTPTLSDYHTRFNSQEIKQLSTVGADIKFGYEMTISKTASVNLGPVINFYDLGLLHKKNNSIGPSIVNDYVYDYYIGLDVAFNFGWK